VFLSRGLGVEGVKSKREQSHKLSQFNCSIVRYGVHSLSRFKNWMLK
jgi:hypothetical protein